MSVFYILLMKKAKRTSSAPAIPTGEERSAIKYPCNQSRIPAPSIKRVVRNAKRKNSADVQRSSPTPATKQHLWIVR